MSRYKQSRKATNRDEMYKDVFDRKGVQSITQFRSKKFKQIEESVKQRINFREYVWKYGDTFQMLASLYYSDPKLWWIIASFNNIPTEAELNIGDTIRIPTSVAEVLQVI